MKVAPNGYCGLPVPPWMTSLTMLETLFPGGLTHDTLLSGRVNLAQPKGGYRVAIDPVMLAASVQAQPDETIADLGCGTGAVAFCLAARLDTCRVTGLELQPDLVELASANVAANGLDARVQIVPGDVSSPPFEPGSFDHVAMNPPYLAASRATAPPERLRRVAAVEGEAQLDRWLQTAWELVRPGGTISLVHRADRLDEILVGFRGLQSGGVVAIPLWPKAGVDARRVLVRCRKGDASPFRLQAGLVLHKQDGSYTSAATKILRDGAPLDEALASL